jgi:hypothetical protein
MEDVFPFDSGSTLPNHARITGHCANTAQLSEQSRSERTQTGWSTPRLQQLARRLRYGTSNRYGSP